MKTRIKTLITILLCLAMPVMGGVMVINSFRFTGGSSPGGLPLDSYESDLLASCSVARRLLTSYTGNLIKIRRSSDNTTTDIGYDGNGDLDIPAVISFVGSNSAYIHTIYDQSGNGNNLVMTTNGQQMRIVNAGVFDTLDGKATAYNAGVTNTAGYATATFTTYTGTTLSCFARGLTPSPGDYYARFVSLSKDSGADYGASGSACLILQSAGGGYWTTYRTSDLGNTINTPALADGLISAIADGTNIKLRDGTHTGSAASSASWDFNHILLGNQSDTAAGAGGGCKYSELILWTSDQTSNEAAIRDALAYQLNTSYDNPHGTGDRTGIITITDNVTYGTGDNTKLINGTISATNCYWVSVGSNSTLNVQFDFGSGKVIDEAKWYQSHASSHGTWQWEGSNDASSWTAIGATFDLGGSAGTETLTTLSGNTTFYRYYRLHGISGNVSSGPWLYEIEFKISL